MKYDDSDIKSKVKNNREAKEEEPAPTPPPKPGHYRAEGEVTLKSAYRYIPAQIIGSFPL